MEQPSAGELFDFLKPIYLYEENDPARLSPLESQKGGIYGANHKQQHKYIASEHTTVLITEHGECPPLIPVWSCLN
jgi:hypothetical protein